MIAAPELFVRHPLTLRVSESIRLAEGVLGLSLVNAGGGRLPAWTPGAHIDLVLPSGATRSYSLCGDLDGEDYRIAVLHEPNGRGASREIHETQLAGALLKASTPRNQFELIAAPHTVFIAGGIGITPLLPMVRTVAATESSWELHYLGRARARMSFVDILAGYAEQSGGRFTLVARDERNRIAIGDILERAPAGSAVYCCGPDMLIQEVEQLCRSLGSQIDLHVERFGRPTLLPHESQASGLNQPTANVDTSEASDPDGPFQVELVQTGVVLDIGPGESILDYARKVRTGLSFSCSDGYCGTCETTVIAGTPDHRDTVLTDDEKAANTTMMICVGRSRSKRLVLDL